MQLHLHRQLGALTLAASSVLWIACSSSSDGPGAGNGGATSTTGGSATGTGGTGSGGQLGQGGSSGGAVSSGSGGQVGTGGAVSTSGGSSGGNGRGGRAGMGGDASAGRSNGGSANSGGSVGSANGGASTAGAAGSTATGMAAPSAGCGKAAALMNGRASIDVGGKTREYILALPSNYDQNHPYRLIFGWHPWGGSAQQVASGGYYGLLKESKDTAIFVAAEGLPFGDNGDKGWGNSNGEDIALLGAMLERFRSGLCIDDNRIFSTGFSFGGMFSFAAGCSATSMMRAIAPMAGNTSVAGCGNGTRPVALMGFHGVDDQVVAIDGGRKGRDAFVQRNGCSKETVPATTTWCTSAGSKYEPCSCVSYQGCKEGYPVTWCEYKGQHMPAPNSASTLWTFFSQF